MRRSGRAQPPWAGKDEDNANNANNEDDANNANDEDDEDDVAEQLTDRLAAAAAAVGAGGADRVPLVPPPAAGRLVLARKPDGTVVRCGEAVAKAHAADTDRERLAVRVRTAAHPLLRGILLAPLPGTGTGTRGPLGALPDGRLVTRWPYGTPVDPDDPDAAPWAEAGRLLARLHTVPLAGLPGPLPVMGGPGRAVRALVRMRRAPQPPRSAVARAARVVEQAWAELPGWARGEAPAPYPRALCHGDLHLGQLVRHPRPGGPWQLIDIDDLGAGPPAWDLARPAAWFATGLLPPADWDCFLTAYRDAGGCAVPADGDPWPALDTPARALTVQLAALAIARAGAEDRPLDEVEQAMADACHRMTTPVSRPEQGL